MVLKTVQDAITRYESYMIDFDIIIAVLDLAPYSTQYSFIKTIYSIECTDNINFIEYKPLENSIIINYSDNFNQKIINIPNEWEF